MSAETKKGINEENPAHNESKLSFVPQTKRAKDSLNPLEAGPKYEETA